MMEDSEFIYDLGNDGHNEMLLSKFEELPSQAKALFLNSLAQDQYGHMGTIFYINGIACEGCESPIESIFYMALGIAVSNRLEKETHIVDWDNDIVHSTIWLEVYPQYEITAYGHNYRADFLLMVEYYSDDWENNCQDENIIIECDGHDYHHADKSQVSHDYEREMNLEKAGYKIMRFTGTQIYNDPMKCANDVVDYLVAEMNRRHDEFLKEEERDGR